MSPCRAEGDESDGRVITQKGVDQIGTVFRSNGARLISFYLFFFLRLPHYFVLFGGTGD
jgi:hypothetical protein